MGGSIPERIEAANQKAMDIILKAQPTWVDVRLAGEVVPGLTKNVVMVAGPLIRDLEKLQRPIQGSIIGAILHEGWAESREEAWQLALRGEVKVESCLDHRSAGSALSPMSPSQPVIVAKDTETGNEAYVVFWEGPYFEALRWGVYNDTIRERLLYLKNVMAPAFGAIVRHMGGVNLRTLVARGTPMGDENHTHQLASNSLMWLYMIKGLAEVDFDRATVNEVLKFMNLYERFFLNVFMAGSAAVMEAAKGIEYSTVAVAMGGNTDEFGMKFSGTGDEWFTVPAPRIQGLPNNPAFTDDKVGSYGGDSCITEMYGFGGLAAAAGPSFVRLSGGDINEAIRRTEEARTVCLGTHDWAPIPLENFQGVPVGIDMRKVVATGVTPTSHGGVSFLEGGGPAMIGSCPIPMECFAKGLKAFAQKYGL